MPLFIGAWFGRLDYGLVSSLGGLVFLYTPQTEMAQRMLTLMACAFGMIACYALGIISHFYPPAIILVLSFLTVVVTMACRTPRAQASPISAATAGRSGMAPCSTLRA